MLTVSDQFKAALLSGVVKVVPKLEIQDSGSAVGTVSIDTQADWQAGTITGTTMDATTIPGSIMLKKGS